MKINVHAGHNPDGKVASGAAGLIKESTQARKVKGLLIRLLRDEGHKVYDCTCSNGEDQSDVLKRIVTKCNDHSVDIDVSIHFNSGAGDKKGNGKTTGTEVLVYSSSGNPEDSKAYTYAKRTLKEITALGFKSRGVKVRNDLYVLKNTESKAMLIECCFVDDKDDVALYKAEEMAKAIAKGITGKDAGEKEKEEKTGGEDKKNNQDKKSEKHKDSGATYIVKAKSGLNVRKGPGTNYGKVKALRYGEKISVSDISNGWGQIKDGWICMKYTDKI